MTNKVFTRFVYNNKTPHGEKKRDAWEYIRATPNYTIGLVLTLKDPHSSNKLKDGLKNNRHNDSNT